MHCRKRLRDCYAVQHTLLLQLIAGIWRSGRKKVASARRRLLNDLSPLSLTVSLNVLCVSACGLREEDEV